MVISGDTANKNIQFCNAKLNDNGDTSVMNTHLSTHQKDIKFHKKNVNEEIKTDWPSSIKSALLNSNYYEIESPKYQLLTDSVLTCLTECYLPLSLVDNDLIELLLPFFELTVLMSGT